jgi:hypothetical protein
MGQLPNTSFVSANLNWQGDDAFVNVSFVPFSIFQIGGEKVGVTGHIVQDMRNLFRDPGILVSRRLPWCEIGWLTDS